MHRVSETCEKNGNNVNKLRKKTSGQGYTSTIAKPPVLQRQLMAVMALTMVPIDARLGLSILWGFSVCLLPSACFTWYAHSDRGARAVATTVIGFYRAEAVKFVLTASLFAVVFLQADKIHPAVFFLAFVVAQICSWVLVAVTLRQRPR
jgi:ATP synthase protein I